MLQKMTRWPGSTMTAAIGPTLITWGGLGNGFWIIDNRAEIKSFRNCNEFSDIGKRAQVQLCPNLGLAGSLQPPRFLNLDQSACLISRFLVESIRHFVFGLSPLAALALVLLSLIWQHWLWTCQPKSIFSSLFIGFSTGLDSFFESFIFSSFVKRFNRIFYVALSME